MLPLPLFRRPASGFQLMQRRHPAKLRLRGIFQRGAARFYRILRELTDCQGHALEKLSRWSRSPNSLSQQSQSAHYPFVRRRSVRSAGTSFQVLPRELLHCFLHLIQFGFALW